MSIESLRPLLELARPYAPLVLYTSAIIVAGALVWLFVSERQRVNGTPDRPANPHQPFEATRMWILLGVIVLVAAFLRLWGLDAGSLSHPEIYNPGLALPPGISEPPPRTDFWETLAWHFNFEPHPLGYYMAMLGWSKLFGTELFTLRLPSALMGAASVLLVFRIGAMTYGRSVGLLAAALLAVHGYHMYWSQIARMYIPGSFLGLLATWLFLEILKARRKSLGLEFAYVAVIVAGLLTQWFFWLVIAAHTLWVVLNMTLTAGRPPRLLYFQMLAAILGTHTLSHALVTAYRAASGRAPTLESVADFIAFGFLLQKDELSAPIRIAPLGLRIAALALALVLLFRALRKPFKHLAQSYPAEAPSLGPLFLAATGMTAFAVALALPIQGRFMLVALASIVPLSAFALLPASGAIGPLLARTGAAWKNRIGIDHLLASPIAILALAPTTLVVLVSLIKPMMVARALLISVPYLMILMAVGACTFAKQKYLRLGIAGMLVALSLFSVFHFKRMPTSSVDYHLMAKTLRENLEPGDVIFVRFRDWRTTPLFYYLNGAPFVASNYREVLAESPDTRVWLLTFADRQPTQEMLEALQPYKVTKSLTGTLSTSFLYQRKALINGKPVALPQPGNTPGPNTTE